MLFPLLSAGLKWRRSDQGAREPISWAAAARLFSTACLGLARSLAHRAWLWSDLTLFDKAGCGCSSWRQRFQTMPCWRDAIFYRVYVDSYLLQTHSFLGVLKMGWLWNGRHLFTWVTTALLRQTKFSSNHWVTVVYSEIWESYWRDY